MIVFNNRDDVSCTFKALTVKGTLGVTCVEDNNGLAYSDMSRVFPDRIHTGQHYTRVRLRMIKKLNQYNEVYKIHKKTSQAFIPLVDLHVETRTMRKTPVDPP